MFKMIYGYARVSTLNQDLAAQLQELSKEGAEVIFQEKISGKNVKDRPELQKLLAAIQPGDTLVVTRLDRLARTLIEGTTLIESLFNQGVRIHILNMGMLENTTVGKLLFNVLLTIAEFERATIVERTQEGKAIAKLNPDFKEGRPKKFPKTQLDHAMKLLETHSFNQVSDLTGISISTLKRESSARKKAALA